jgi:hypothetical protein
VQEGVIHHQVEGAENLEAYDSQGSDVAGQVTDVPGGASEEIIVTVKRVTRSAGGFLLGLKGLSDAILRAVAQALVLSVKTTALSPD